MRILNHFCDDFYVVTSEKTEATTPSAPHTTHQHSPRCYLNLPAGLPSVRVERHAQRTQRPSPAFQTTSSSLTYSDLSNLSIPQISQGSVRPVSRAMRDAVAATGLEFKEIHVWKAAKLGCLRAVKRLQRRGRLTSGEYTLCSAAGGGHLEVLQWLRANDCPWVMNTCSRAVEGRHLEVLQWARANGCQWNERTCTWAAWWGRLEILKWAHENGCPWDAKTCAFALMGGHLDVLQWARANGCQ